LDSKCLVLGWIYSPLDLYAALSSNAMRYNEPEPCTLDGRIIKMAT
jgi:hypothetical protein